MKFELNEKEVEAKDEFYKACKYLLKGENVNLSFIFTPTGVGNSVDIYCKELDISRDITDYDKW